MAFRFESLEIWHKAIDYGCRIYDLADSLPKHEIFGLGSQFRRSAVSMSNNIAEGSGSQTAKDFKNYLDISIKSAIEIISMLFFAEKRGYITPKEREVLYQEGELLIKRIVSFKKTLKKERYDV